MQMKFKQYEVSNRVWKQKRKKKKKSKQFPDFRQTFIHLSSKHIVESTKKLEHAYRHYEKWLKNVKRMLLKA